VVPCGTGRRVLRACTCANRNARTVLLVSAPRQAETRLAVAGDLPDKDLPVFATMIGAERRRGRNNSESNGAPGNRRHWITSSARSSSAFGMHVKGKVESDSTSDDSAGHAAAVRCSTRIVCAF
jgi:hypothetical protein